MALNDHWLWDHWIGDGVVITSSGVALLYDSASVLPWGTPGSNDARTWRLAPVPNCIPTGRRSTTCIWTGSTIVKPDGAMRVFFRYLGNEGRAGSSASAGLTPLTGDV